MRLAGGSIGAIIGIALSLLLRAIPALAQPTANQPIPPTAYNIDENGVDVVSGQYYFQTNDVMNGGDGDSGLSYTRSTRNLGYDDNYETALHVDVHIISVSIGGTTDRFGAPFGPTPRMSQQGTGAQLTGATDGSTYTYTTKAGVAYVFESFYSSQFYRSADQRATSITWPNGKVVLLQYERPSAIPTVCVDPGDCVPTRVWRLSDVSSNDGYRLALRYVVPTLPPSSSSNPISREMAVDWMTVASVVGTNAGALYCDSASTSSDCLPGGTSPNIQYSWNAAGRVETRTDAEGRQKAVTYDINGRITDVTQSSAGNAPARLTYHADGRVESYEIGVGSASAAKWLYSYVDNSPVTGQRTTTVTSPTNLVRTVISDTDKLRILSDKLGTQSAMTYTYDINTRPDEIIMPEGNKVKFVYDARSNITSTTLTPKTGSGTIVTSATYPSTCPNTATCNLPETTTDARGNVTNYTYTSFGAPETVTRPAPIVNGVRPQMRYSYTPKKAWYRTSSSSGIVEAASAIQRLTATSSCSYGNSCTGQAIETVSEISYGTGSSAAYNNLLPLATTFRSGNTSGTGAVASTESFTYDTVGNVTSVNGPLGTVDDISYTRYDRNRQIVGTIGPDPDGSGGSLKHRATRITRNATTGLVTAVEAGTVNGPSDPDWAAFAMLQRLETDYDLATYRKVEERGRGIDAVTGNTLYSLTQYSYDPDLRPKCTATRVALAAASNVCAQGSTTAGFDMVTETVYGSDARIEKSRENLTDTIRYTYTANGQVQTLKDADGNTTTYAYDGYDRPNRTTYANTTFDAVSYDAASNVEGETRRNGATVTNTYDNLNRLKTRTPSGSSTAAVTYSYDLFDRLDQAKGVGEACPGAGCPWQNELNYSYDALSRLTGSNVATGGAGYHPLTMEYDAAGRRTRLTWWDGFYVAYDHLVTGEVTKLTENRDTPSPFVLGTYTYDDLGRRRSLVRGNGVTTAWTPDGFSRLKAMSDSGFASASPNQTLTMGYNPVQQLKTREATNDGYSFPNYKPTSQAVTPNALNQMATLNSVAPSYDTNGNLTGDTRGNTYTYNTDNQLVSKTSGSVFGYDPLGNLSSIVGTATTLFYYDGADMIAEANGSGNTQRRYVHGPGVDEPLVWYEGAGTTDRRWLNADERGSVTAITNGTGAVFDINAYDENGVPAARNIGRWGYTGQAWLSEAGVAYYKARMYDPVIGRFLQSDPIGYDSGMNLYTYVRGDPINYLDPSGLCQFAGQGSKTVNTLNEIVITCPSWNFGFGGGSSGQGVPSGSNTRVGNSQKQSAKDSPQNEDIVVTAKKAAKKFGQCVAAQYGFGDGTVSAGLNIGKIASQLGGIPLPKRWLGVPLAGGEGVSRFTNAISYIPFKLGIRANTGSQIFGSGRVFGILGRLNAPVAAALFAYDAISITVCLASDRP